jgi:hypothetical protein
MDVMSGYAMVAGEVPEEVSKEVLVGVVMFISEELIIRRREMQNIT